jgi:hypothetical protein
VHQSHILGIYIIVHIMRCEVPTVIKIQVVVFCVMTPYSDVVRYQHFGGP